MRTRRVVCVGRMRLREDNRIGFGLRRLRLCFDANERRDFRFDVLTGSSAFSAQDSLFAHLGKHEIFMPTKTWAPMTVGELAANCGRFAAITNQAEETKP